MKRSRVRRTQVEEEPPRLSAPFWFISWADMITVLFAFFVALFSMSRLETERFGKFLEGIRGKRPVPENPLVPGSGESGRDLRPGPWRVRGAWVPFETGSAELSPAARRDLLRAAEQLRGARSRVQVRGYAFPRETEEKTAAEAMELAYARAREGVRALTDPRWGNLSAHRIQIAVAALSEPEGTAVPVPRLEVIDTSEPARTPWESDDPRHRRWLAEKRRAPLPFAARKEDRAKLSNAREGMSGPEAEEILGAPLEKQRYRFDDAVYEEWRYPGGTLRFFVHPEGELGTVMAVGAGSGWGF